MSGVAVYFLVGLILAVLLLVGVFVYNAVTAPDEVVEQEGIIAAGFIGPDEYSEYDWAGFFLFAFIVWFAWPLVILFVALVAGGASLAKLLRSFK